MNCCKRIKKHSSRATLYAVPGFKTVEMQLYSQITKVYPLGGMCSDGILIYPLPFSLTDIVGLGGAATVTMIVTVVNILDSIHSQTLQSDDRGF